MGVCLHRRYTPYGGIPPIYIPSTPTIQTLFTHVRVHICTYTHIQCQRGVSPQNQQGVSLQNQMGVSLQSQKGASLQNQQRGITPKTKRGITPTPTEGITPKPKGVSLPNQKGYHSKTKMGYQSKAKQGHRSNTKKTCITPKPKGGYHSEAKRGYHSKFQEINPRVRHDLLTPVRVGHDSVYNQACSGRAHAHHTRPARAFTLHVHTCVQI